MFGNGLSDGAIKFMALASTELLEADGLNKSFAVYDKNKDGNLSGDELVKFKTDFT